MFTFLHTVAIAKGALNVSSDTYGGKLRGTASRKIACPIPRLFNSFKICGAYSAIA
ncbi:hypothetical protein [Nostoc sp.]